MTAQPADGSIQKGMRVESDSMGTILVPANRYWGAQTQRCLTYFSIGEERIPRELIRALAILKKAAALANRKAGAMKADTGRLIVRAAEEVIDGKLDDHFPLNVWISGSGTQCNMNVNEVIANRAIELAGGAMGTRKPVHPNDHVNMSQSTNDAFPSAIQIATAMAVQERLIPAVRKMRNALDKKAVHWAAIAKTGRTHMMDAVPLTLGQEFHGYVGMLDDNLERIGNALPGLYRLAIGGTAVGTGLNAAKGFARNAAREISRLTRLPFVSAANKFAVQGAHDAMVATSGVLRTLAVSLYKIANDIRLLASGPRCGLQELILPENEPGSSIMPGKVNPTQCEAMTMAAVQIMGYDVAVGIAGAGGYLEMNVYKPLIGFNVIHSIGLASDVCNSFTDNLVVGLTPNLKQIASHVDRSLMLVTALSPVVGYDRAAEIAHLASEQGLTLKEAALKLGYVSAREFDRIVNPRKMVLPE